MKFVIFGAACLWAAEAFSTIYKSGFHDFPKNDNERTQ